MVAIWMFQLETFTGGNISLLFPSWHSALAIRRRTLHYLFWFGANSDRTVLSLPLEPDFELLLYYYWKYFNLLHASNSVTVLYHQKCSNLNCTEEANVKVWTPVSVVTVDPSTTSVWGKGGERTASPQFPHLPLHVCLKIEYIYDVGLTSETTVLFLNA